ncbi:MAG: WYL domain-containing protein [Planctomycetes bacterium]|nr:WYL domain-containing protein [Planctomycetota bacterium]
MTLLPESGKIYRDSVASGLAYHGRPSRLVSQEVWKFLLNAVRDNTWLSWTINAFPRTRSRRERSNRSITPGIGTIRAGKDGSVTLSFPAPNLEEVKRWVLQWGAGAEVIKPHELRKAVRLEALRLARSHA